jgi:hypothetical protein
MSVLFMPLAKVDAVKRMVYGTAISEVADRAGEIFDYASSKPEFEKWSSDVSKATGGKSLGNIRANHGNSKFAVGKITDLKFQDAEKAIWIGAKIVDDDAWQKIEEGIYTGFSIAGRYLRRWQDGALKRYTASPIEISLVDLPCVPTATFEMIKVDGTTELRKFATSSERMSDAELIAAARTAELRHFHRDRISL